MFNYLNTVRTVFTITVFLIITGCSQLPLNSLKDSTKKIWVERNGVAVIEVENEPSLSDSSQNWKIISVPKGYTGTGFVAWNGPADWGPESRPYDTFFLKERKLTYFVKISTNGTYYLKVRNYHLHEDGDNDTWVSVSGSDWGKLYDHDVASFTFDERGPWAKYNLDKGLIKVELAGRSTGFSADRIVLYLSSINENIWSDINHPESKIIRK